MPAPRDVQWDIVDLHLDEAEFLVERWHALRRSTRHGLRVLHQRVERRLLANIDGLIVNGPEPIERWVLPVLHEDEPDNTERLTAATMAAASAGHPLIHERLERAAQAAGERGLEDRALDALVWGLCLAQGPELERELRTQLGRASGNPLASLLEICAGRGLDAGEPLDAALRSDNPLVRRAALRAARAGERERWLPSVEQALASGPDDVRAAAIDTASAWGSGRALEAAHEWRGTASEPSTLLVFECAARSGELRSVAALEERLQQLDTRAAAAWALGFSGLHEAITACTAQLAAADPRACRLAADSLAVMLGLNRDDPSLWISQTPETEDSDEIPAGPLDPDDLDLPTPNAPAIAQWWEQHQSQFPSGQRYLAGTPVAASPSIQSLRTLSSRRTDQWVLGTFGSAGASWPRRAPAGVLLRRMGDVRSPGSR